MLLPTLLLLGWTTIFPTPTPAMSKQQQQDSRICGSLNDAMALSACLAGQCQAYMPDRCKKLLGQ